MQHEKRVRLNSCVALVLLQLTCTLARNVQIHTTSGTAHVVAASTVRLLDIRGDGWTASTGLANAIDVTGIVFSVSDFSAEYILFSGDRTNDTPLKNREGMIRFENASDINVDGCAMLDAGHSAVWLQGEMLPFFSPHLRCVSSAWVMHAVLSCVV
jgi:hypothetical protein